MVRPSVFSGERLPSNSDIDKGGDASALFVHGSAVQIMERGILLLGPSASGKSDLALRLIDAGAVLIADDQVGLVCENGRLLARPPARLAGMIELRGIGIMRVPYRSAPLDLAVDLELSVAVEQLPEPETISYLGVDLPKIRLDARAPSAVARIKMVLGAERVF